MTKTLVNGRRKIELDEVALDILIRDIQADLNGGSAMWALEKIWARNVSDQYGNRNKDIVSQGNQLRDYGIIRGALRTLIGDYRLVAPATWKAKVLANIPKTCDPKDQSILYVRHNFPDAPLLRSSRHRKPCDGRADALCIAQYNLLDKLT